MSLKVLIAEDEAIIRLGLVAMLKEMGYTRVRAVRNGREALQAAREFRPDVALLDIKMPDVDGLEAAEAINRQRPTPVVILTAYSEAELVERAAGGPVMAYLLKPVKPEELEAALPLAHATFQKLRGLRAEAERLGEQIASRDVVQAAQRRLMAKGLSEDEAYQRLQVEARRSRRPMAVVAQEMLAEASEPRG